MSKTNNPHDKLFKAAFTRKNYVENYLKAFLAENMLEKLDLTTLEYNPDSFITPNLQEYFSDVVWSCQLTNHKSVRVALLFEHKSYLVEYPHFQILRYMLEIWEFQYKNKEKLTPVIPIIFYHGETGWVKRSIIDYFEDFDEVFHCFLPLFDFILTDISQLSNEEFFKLKIGLLANAFALFKNKTKPNFIRDNIAFLFQDIKEHIKDENERNFFESILVYLYNITDFSVEERKAIFEQLDESLKSTAMTTYDRIIEEGVQKGIEKDKVEVIKRLYLKGQKAVYIAEIVDLPLEKVEKIITSFKKERN